MSVHFRCPYCARSFARAGALAEHLTEAHRRATMARRARRLRGTIHPKYQQRYQQRG